jgi:hypothetical protein
MNIAQLVQDVIDGKESAVKAMQHIEAEKQFIERCFLRVREIAVKELLKKELNEKTQ